MNAQMLLKSWILVLGLLAVTACSGGGGPSGPGEEGGEDVVRDDVGTSMDLLAEDLPAATDAASEVAGEDTVVLPLELPPEFTCGAPNELIPCDAVGPVPSEPATIAQWAGTNAIPLRCDEGQGEHWDFDIFASEAQGMGLIFMGEVHGSNEIGTASADLFEALVYGAGVNKAALEMGMDTSDAMLEYILTGDETVLDDGLYWDQYKDVMFRKTIPRRARKIYEDTGVVVPVIGVDTPQRLAWVNERIAEIAEGLGAQAKGLLLDVIPEPKEPPYGSWGMGLDSAYVSLSKNYHQHVVDHKDVICADLDPETCEDLEFLAWALYTGAVFNSNDFQMAMMGQGSTFELMAWMGERESLLDYNFRRAAPDASTVIYSHMGAAHCAKGGWNVAGLLQEDYPPLQGRVYSITPAYGDGSKIFYGIQVQPLPAEPTALAGYLTQLPKDNYFITANQPGQDCSANPFSSALAQRVGSQYGAAYDAFFWFRALTPEQEGWGWGKPGAAADWRRDFIRNQVERMRFADQMMEELP